ncbi:2-dehydropantoate 2-reductase [Actimicrobium sp. CCI2.3]|uniref:2-dehydropantoate 2-reductase n=1 Tax=Actimicrobium sp. CCI2.3 TaxID=3048616 RepID=UPI002AB4F72D|nr:2-dehydropantoate 2-reductase [Actimicrobium sp. CCI2.3]MDY7575723.1 2-dehydropantoate 2-reductase [Actimicrobium sp. CCI2.3]MEB0023762.1 2-dehydropantoate 2-reductase [Actimicrobium sp. CCI2.3]
MTRRLVVLGSGSIGTYVGGALLDAGADVVLIGRERMRQRLLQHGLMLSDMQQREVRLAGSDVPYHLDPHVLASADLILLTVKSSDTAAAAGLILQHANPVAPVLSLQNGIGNVVTLRQLLPDREVLGGMVPFNVVQTDDGRLHRGTQGELMVEASPLLAAWLPLFASAHLPLIERTDFLEVQWGKLLLNLNNPLNALSGLPLKTQLSQRAWRSCLALLIDEALAMLDAAGIAPVQVAAIPPRRLPLLLRLPDWLFKRIAAKMLRIDPEARSSMWEDLQAGRQTEIAYLNGAVVALAASLGRAAPANRLLVELVREAENGAARQWDGIALLQALHRA